jgi:hypothetical protein
MTFLASWLVGKTIGGFTIPPWLAKLLERLAFVLVGLLILWGIYHEIRVSGERAQQDKDAAEIANLRTNVSTLEANVRTKDTQIGQQNASIDALKKDGDAKAAAALVERDNALKANKALTDQSAALSASAARPSGKPCGVSDALKSARDL